MRIGYLRPVAPRRVAPVVQTQPDNAQWGPPLWRIFHAMAERSGRHTKPLFDDEENRLWLKFLSNLRKSLPCNICKQHYIEYFTSHNFDMILSKKGVEKQNAIRKYFFDFHNAVNERTGKVFAGGEAELNSIYGSYTAEQFAADKAIVLDNMNRAIQYGINSRDDVVRTVRGLEELWLRFL